MSDLFGKKDEIKSILEDDDLDVELYLVHWTSSKKVKTVCPTISKNIKSKIKDIILKSISNERLDELNESNYNIIGVDDNTLERVNLEQYKKEICVVLDSLQKTISTYKFSNDKFSFFIYKVKSKSNYFYAFSKSRSLKMIKKGLFGRVSNSTFTKIEDLDNLICIDEQVDLLIYEKNVYILNHLSFERIFKISDEFKKIAEEFLDKEDYHFKDKIDHFDKFKKDALSNGNIKKRIVKLSESGKLATSFLNDLEKTKDINDNFDLGLDIDVSKNKIIYRDISQLGSLINFMQDSYYETLVRGEHGIDPRR